MEAHMRSNRDLFAESLYRTVVHPGVLSSDDPEVSAFADMSFEGVAVSEVLDMMRLDGVQERQDVDEYANAVFAE
jgi:hypothetical protein